MSEISYIHPEGWKAASGYSNGVLIPAGWRTLYVAGQVAWDADQAIVGGSDFAAQFDQALANVVSIVEAAGGKPEHIARMTIYVTDKAAYLASTKSLGPIWRDRMGRSYPAMALVQVAGLVEEGAMLEIEATAAFP